MNINSIVKALKKARTAVRVQRDRLDDIADDLDTALGEVEAEQSGRLAQEVLRDLGIKVKREDGETIVEEPARARLDKAIELLTKKGIRFSVSSRTSEQGGGSRERTSLEHYWALSVPVRGADDKPSRKLNAKAPANSILAALESLADEDDRFERRDWKNDRNPTTYIYRFDRDESVMARRLERDHVLAIKLNRERRPA